jgi:DNA-binding transcriptional regulator YiaG
VVDRINMRKTSLRSALRQEIRRAVARQGALISKRLDRTRARLRVLRATVRRQAVELARAQRRLEALRIRRASAARVKGAAAGPAMSPRQIRAARGGLSRRAFAEVLGVSANSIFLWETGRARPRGVNLARLRRAKPKAARRGPGRPPGRRRAAKRTARARTRRTASARPRRPRAMRQRKAA